MYKFAFVLLIYLLELSRFSNSIVIKLFTVMLFSFAIVDNLLKHKTSISVFKINKIYLIFLSIVVIAVFRNNNTEQSMSYNIFRILNFLLFFILFFQTIEIYLKKKVDYFTLFLKTIYFPFLLLILLNLLAFSINISPNTDIGRDGLNEVCVLLGSIGIKLYRVDFPFSPGFNAYGSLVGVFFTFSLIGYFIIKKWRKLFIVGSVTSCITILMIDTRSAFFISLVILLLSLVMKNYKKPKLLWLIPLITVFGNLIIISTLTFLSTIKQFSFLERNSGDLETGNARTIIWLFSGLEFSNFKPMHLIGFGEFGQFGSGASLNWSYIFPTFENPELTSPHSLLFLILFDYGYLGLLIIVLLQYKVVKITKDLWNLNKDLAIMILSFLIYWNLMGMTESFFGIYTTKIMIVFCSITFFTYQLSNYIKTKRI